MSNDLILSDHNNITLVKDKDILYDPKNKEKMLHYNEELRNYSAK